MTDVSNEVKQHMKEGIGILTSYLNEIDNGQNRTQTLGLICLTGLMTIINNNPKAAAHFARHILSYAPNPNPLIQRHLDSVLSGELDEFLNNPEIYKTLKEVFGKKTVTH